MKAQTRRCLTTSNPERQSKAPKYEKFFHPNFKWVNFRFIIEQSALTTRGSSTRERAPQAHKKSYRLWLRKEVAGSGPNPLRLPYPPRNSSWNVHEKVDHTLIEGGQNILGWISIKDSRDPRSCAPSLDDLNLLLSLPHTQDSKLEMCTWYWHCVGLHGSLINVVPSDLITEFFIHKKHSFQMSQKKSFGCVHFLPYTVIFANEIRR